MADYRYLVDANIHWKNNDEKSKEITSFLINCARDLGTSLTEGTVFGLIKEAYKLVAPLELFGCCPYYIESMKQNYVWPYYTESAAEAYHFRVLVFATAYFLFLLANYEKRAMRSYYKAFVSKQGGYVDQFEDWEAAAEKLHFNYAFEKERHLKDIRGHRFYRNPWNKITDDFKAEVMVRILDRYKTLENKKRVLDCMEAFCLIRPQFAYMLDAERPGSIAKFREWVEKEVKINPYSSKKEYAIYEKDYLIVPNVNDGERSGHIGGRSKLPRRFITTTYHAIGHGQRDSDEPDWNSTGLNWNSGILNMIVILWNKYNKTQIFPDSTEDFDYIGNEWIDVDVWLFFYALLSLKSDRKDWEKQFMQIMKTLLSQPEVTRPYRLDYYKGNAFDEIEKAFKKESKCLTDADFQANLVEWKHLDEKDWAYATRGFRKDDMLIFIKAGRTQVEQWRLAEALEKSYAKLVDSDEMSKIDNFNALVDLENIKDEILQGTYLEGAKPIDSEEMYKRLKRKQYEELEKEMEVLKAENERLKESPLETGVKWTGGYDIDLLRIILAMYRNGLVKYGEKDDGKNQGIVLKKLGQACGKSFDDPSVTLSNSRSNANIYSTAPYKVFVDMIKAEIEYYVGIGEKDKEGQRKMWDEITNRYINK